MSADRITGLLVGAAVGDALGAPHEFHNFKYTGQFQYTPRYFQRFQNRWIVYSPGQYTDDTEMMMCLARVLSNGSYTPEKALDQYLQWANDNTHTLGKNTRALFKGIKTIKGYYGRVKKMALTSQSNGALMRCAVLAVSPDWKDIAVEDCRLTNPDPICLETNKIYLTAIRAALLREQDREVIFSVAAQAATLSETQAVVTAVQQKEVRIVTGPSKGWCLHALYLALYTLRYCQSYKEAIDWTIMQGGDTDTNACIVGALWGALTGFDQLRTAIPNEVHTVLECTTEATIPLKENEVMAVRSDRHRAHHLQILGRQLAQS